MSENTKIQWCSHTFNPWRGCTKVAPECQFCYADTQSKRNPAVLGVWGPSGTRVVAAESTWRQPIKWNREAEQAGERRRVFCASLADVFEDWSGDMLGSNGKPVFVCECGRYSQLETKRCKGCKSIRGSRITTMADVRRRVFSLIDATPWLDWILLTKRPENIRRMWPETPGMDCPRCDGEGGNDEGGPCGLCQDQKKYYHLGNPLYRKNVWLITSAGTQATADKFIPELLQCRDLVPVLGVSAEPLLGPVDLSKYLGDRWECPECGDDDEHGKYLVQPLPKHRYCGVCAGDCGRDVALRRLGKSLHWAIVGGESGHHARPCDVAWMRSIVEQCRAAGVPVFVKQLGSKPFIPDEYGDDWQDPYSPYRLILADTKVGDPAEWPEDLRIREFPK